MATSLPGDDRPRGVRFGARCAAAGGEQSSGGQEHVTRKPVSQQAETSRTPWPDSGARSRGGRGGANRRGGEKPRGRNAVGRGKPGPASATRQREVEVELTPGSNTAEGRCLTTPREVVQPETLNGMDRNASGKLARKIKRVERLTSLLAQSDPPVGPRRPVWTPRKRRRRTRSWRAATKPTGRNDRRGSPPYASTRVPGRPSRNGRTRQQCQVLRFTSVSTPSGGGSGGMSSGARRSDAVGGFGLRPSVTLKITRTAYLAALATCPSNRRCPCLLRKAGCRADRFLLNPL